MRSIKKINLILLLLAVSLGTCLIFFSEPPKNTVKAISKLVFVPSEPGTFAKVNFPSLIWRDPTSASPNNFFTSEDACDIAVQVAGSAVTFRTEMIYLSKSRKSDGTIGGVVQFNSTPMSMDDAIALVDGLWKLLGLPTDELHQWAASRNRQPINSTFTMGRHLPSGIMHSVEIRRSFDSPNDSRIIYHIDFPIEATQTETKSPGAAAGVSCSEIADRDSIHLSTANQCLACRLN
jgi:hypothetical protein